MEYGDDSKAQHFHFFAIIHLHGNPDLSKFLLLDGAGRKFLIQKCLFAVHPSILSKNFGMP
jgi:hypothetical protein